MLNYKDHYYQQEVKVASLSDTEGKLKYTLYLVWLYSTNQAAQYKGHQGQKTWFRSLFYPAHCGRWKYMWKTIVRGFKMCYIFCSVHWHSMVHSSFLTSDHQCTTIIWWKFKVSSCHLQTLKEFRTKVSFLTQWNLKSQISSNSYQAKFYTLKPRKQLRQVAWLNKKDIIHTIH